jgi:hypothetical protein
VEEQLFVRPEGISEPDTAVNAVKRAIIRAFNTTPRLPRGVSSAEFENSVFERVAREAIAAMREPTERMMAAAWTANHKGTHVSTDFGVAWRAMIDVSLND